MKCSIVIPSFNTCELTIACVRSIEKNPPPGDFEIIVVDNNSSDETSQRLRKEALGCLVIQNPLNLGFGRACNQGARIAKGEYILFLNSDTRALPHTFEILIDWLDRHPKTGVVGPELLSDQHRLIQMSWAWNPILLGEFIQRPLAPYLVRKSRFRQWIVSCLQLRPRSVPIICGACMMMRRAAFDDIQGFDESFELYFEDSDVCLRCRGKGWRVDFVPESKVIHHLGQSSKDPWGVTSLVYRQSQISYYRKHAPAWAVPVLKLYLASKWLGIGTQALMSPKEAARSRPYLSSLWKIIRESKHFRLSDATL